jgi:putative membrane protein
MTLNRVICLTLSGCLLVLLSDVSRAQTPGSGAATISAEDRKFILDAAQSGRHEVQMGMLGVERGTSSDLKTYAQRILDDHVLSNAQVEALARLKGVALPDLTKTDTSLVKLSRLSGIEFDREFAREAQEAHARDLAEFQKEDQSGADTDIQGFAHSALPALRTHLEQAKALKP